MFIDTHTHLLSNDFDKDREIVIENAKKMGVHKFLEVGYDIKYMELLPDFINNRKEFFGALGVHPNNAYEFNEHVMKDLESIVLKNNKIVAIGEIGLDYYRDFVSKELQEKVFIMQLDLAVSLKKPVVIHCREAKEDLKNILRRYKNLSGTIHSFSGNINDAEFYIERGFVLGLSGVLTYKSNNPLRELIKILDLQNLVIETDCPYLPPVPHRGERNEPSFSIYIRDEISRQKNIDKTEIDKITNRNILRIFNF